MNLQVLVSVASADQAELGQAVHSLAHAGADAVHLDLEDGVFSPVLTFGVRTVHDLRRRTTLPFDVHLMVARPGAYLEALKAAGADAVTVHLEACPYPSDLLQAIRGLGLRAGLAVNPRTPLEPAAYLIDRVDQLLVMTAEPDGRGQAFLPGMLPKVAQAAALAAGRPVAVLADGGITLEWVPPLRAAGATGVVIGRAFFAAASPERVVQAVRALP